LRNTPMSSTRQLMILQIKGPNPAYYSTAEQK